jgi:hypothetical protein
VPVLRSGRDSAVEVGAVEVEGPAPRPPPCRRREEPTGGVGSNESGGAQIWWRRATRTEPKLRCRWSTATAGGARAKVHGATTERLADEQWLDDSWQVWRKEQERPRPRDEWEEASAAGKRAVMVATHSRRFSPSPPSPLSPELGQRVIEEEDKRRWNHLDQARG